MADTAPLLTIRDLRARLACSKDLAYHLVASGSIPSVRLGTAIRVRPEALERWLLDREQGGSR